MINPTERTGNLVILVCLFGLGMFCVISSRAMPGGQFGEMGPGFFPGLLGAVLAGISLILGGQMVVSRSLQNRVQLGHRDAWSIVASTILLAFIFKPLGFMPSVGLFVCFNIKLLSKLGWIKCIAVSVAAAVSAYLFFSTLLGTPLPLGDWL
jgi:hypothetical protein